MKIKYAFTETFLVILIDAIRTAAKIQRAKIKMRSERIDSRTIILTGTFYSDNWLLTHIAPLTATKAVDRVIMVTDREVPKLDGLIGVVPKKASRVAFGNTIARLITFYRLVRKEKPVIAGGFHLLLNGLVAMLAASSAGSKSLYICGGGPREVNGGGYQTESRLFKALGKPSAKVETSLLKAVDEIDLIIVMGRSAKEYFLCKGVSSQIEIHPGGIDAGTFEKGEEHKKFDLCFVGRLSSVKRPHLFLSVLQELKKQRHGASAVVVGDGPMMEEIKRKALTMGLEGSVNFVGWSNDVAAWMRVSRVFVMTSESEGLSQALIQAGLCGLPAVVSDVGDLSDLVVDGKNGFLIESADPMEFVKKIGMLLADCEFYGQLSLEAERCARAYTLEAAAARWDDVVFPVLFG